MFANSLTFGDVSLRRAALIHSRVCRDGEVMAESEHYSASFTNNNVETWDQGGGNMVGLNLSAISF